MEIEKLNSNGVTDKQNNINPGAIYEIISKINEIIDYINEKEG